MTIFVPFWELRRHGVAEEAVRGGTRRRRTDTPWPLAADVSQRLRSLLEARGFDPARAIVVHEHGDRDGFELSQ